MRQLVADGDAVWALPLSMNLQALVYSEENLKKEKAADAAMETLLSSGHKFPDSVLCYPGRSGRSSEIFSRHIPSQRPEAGMDARDREYAAWVDLLIVNPASARREQALKLAESIAEAQTSPPAADRRSPPAGRRIMRCLPDILFFS